MGDRSEQLKQKVGKIRTEGKKAICKNWRCIFTGGGRGGVVLVVGGLGGSVKTTGPFYDLKR